MPELIDLLAHLTPAIAAGAALGDRKERIDEEDRLAEEERKSKRDIWK